jgi:hypothetical protein
MGSFPSGYFSSILRLFSYQLASMKPCLINAIAPNKEDGDSLPCQPPEEYSII